MWPSLTGCPSSITSTLTFLTCRTRGSIRITQSNAILRYIARQHNMCGKTEEERVRVDMLENQAMDMREAFAEVAYHTYHLPLQDTKKEEYLTDKLPSTLNKLSDFLGDRLWFAGDQITFPDFVIYELLFVNLQMDSSCLANTPNLCQFFKRFEELPTIKRYMASSRYINPPINGPMAKFGGK
ncbi:glutathione S-transferase Mu 4-like isoform X1 [Homarus americanus]|uniref:glutathione S-transferase Mu 4-like isoform X1 n=1 Tax=Homarus americanus TaxID=6706 RepID=UPI001C46B9FD|nr:glutathione S-transferase Mu 4-like isoform X1 [Homarus americanus]